MDIKIAGHSGGILHPLLCLDVANMCKIFDNTIGKVNFGKN